MNIRDEEKICVLSQEISHSDKFGELFSALAKAQGNFKSAAKCKKNPFYKSEYADLPAIWNACREQLSLNGLAIIQTVDGTHDLMFLTTILGHSSGQWIKSKVPLILTKKDPQSMGSCITYARRYALSALVGICQDDEDDDGEEATKPSREQSKNIQPNNPPTEPVVEPELTDKEIYDYLKKNWPGDEDKFGEYLRETSLKAKWSYRKCISYFDRNAEKTKISYMNWCAEKAGQ